MCKEGFCISLYVNFIRKEIFYMQEKNLKIFN